jgi:hypothetical protein
VKGGRGGGSLLMKSDGGETNLVCESFCITGFWGCCLYWLEFYIWVSLSVLCFL